MSPYQLVYGKACHLPLKIKRRALRATKFLNDDLSKEGKSWILPLQKLEEFRNRAYENAKIYKEQTKTWHERRLQKKELQERQLVLLFNSRLKLFPEKLSSRWSRPFVIHKVIPHGVTELKNPANGDTFKVNGQRVKCTSKGMRVV